MLSRQMRAGMMWRDTAMTRGPRRDPTPGETRGKVIKSRGHEATIMPHHQRRETSHASSCCRLNAALLVWVSGLCGGFWVADTDGHGGIFYRWHSCPVFWDLSKGSWDEKCPNVNTFQLIGPILFTLCMLPLGNRIRKHSINVQCYADDAQLYLSIKPEETNQLSKLQASLKDIKTWMTCNFLTKLKLLYSERLRDQWSGEVVSVDGIALASNTTVKNLCSLWWGLVL